ncbi:hypothetical protein BJ138DRAFT_1200548, partial [Hygrophoropsis aurantiaca]
MLLLTETTLFFINRIRKLTSPTTSKKYELIGRVDSWTADVDSSDPDTELGDSHPTSSSIFPTTTTSASSLSKGTIISDRNGPPPTPINKSAEHGVNFRGPFDIEDTDGDDDALAEQLERQAALLRARKKQRVADLVSITPDSEDNGPKNIAVEQPLNMIVDTQDDITFNEGDNDAGFSGITGSEGDVGILHDEDDDDMDSTCEEDATLDRETGVDGDSGSMALKPATEQDDNGSADLGDTAMSFDESESEPDAPPSTQPRAPQMKLSLAQASRPLKRKKLLEPVDSDSSSEVETTDVKVITKPTSRSARLTSTKNVGIKPKATSSAKPPTSKRAKKSETSLASRTLLPPPDSSVKILPRNKYRKDHLPAGVDGPRWRDAFIPTVLLWFGNEQELWTIDEAYFCENIQVIFDTVYGDEVEYTITTNGPVFALVLKRLCEWRNFMGSAALAVLAHFMVSQPDVQT